MRSPCSRAQKVMLIASERESARADAIAPTLPVVHRHGEVVMHVPVEVANPAPVNKDNLTALLQAAWSGEGPR